MTKEVNNSTENIDVPTSEQDGPDVWKSLATEAYSEHVQKISKPQEIDPGDKGNLEFRKFFLLTETALDLAKGVSFDGKLSTGDKKRIAEAFQEAQDLGCERELAKSINEKLKTAGSKQRVILDREAGADGDIAAHGEILKFEEDRKLLVVNIESGEITDSHKFSVSVSRDFSPRPIVPPYDPDELVIENHPLSRSTEASPDLSALRSKAIESAPALVAPEQIGRPKTMDSKSARPLPDEHRFKELMGRLNQQVLKRR